MQKLKFEFRIFLLFTLKDEFIIITLLKIKYFRYKYHFQIVVGTFFKILENENIFNFLFFELKFMWIGGAHQYNSHTITRVKIRLNYLFFELM
jgi:hypothetical protein